MITIFCYKLPDSLEFNEDYSKKQFHSEEKAPIEIKNDSTKFPKRNKKVKSDDLVFGHEIALMIFNLCVSQKNSKL